MFYAVTQGLTRAHHSGYQGDVSVNIQNLQGTMTAEVHITIGRTVQTIMVLHRGSFTQFHGLSETGFRVIHRTEIADAIAGTIADAMQNVGA